MRNGLKVFAHFLPQFHRIPENSEWWGPGFTEWTNVASAKPLYPTHDQPRIPTDLGFYDLSFPETLEEQAQLAKKYGIDGFNFYFYSFNGKRILEKPLDNFLKSKSIAIDFCLTWANENWTRKWDGRNNEVLLKQDYPPQFELSLFEQLVPFFVDDRYLKIDGKPVFCIYKANEIPNARMAIQKLRQLALEEGFPGLYIVAVASGDVVDPRSVGADALMEFPPHQTPASLQLPNPSGLLKKHTGNFWDYVGAATNSLEQRKTDFVFFRGALPGWDNSPRVGPRANIFVGNTPKAFELWLDSIFGWTIEVNTQSERIVFINAWNEWAEGAFLEPDKSLGLTNLIAVQTARTRAPRDRNLIQRELTSLRASAQRSDYSGEPPIFKTSVLRSIGTLTRTLFSWNALKRVTSELAQDPSGKTLARKSALLFSRIRNADFLLWAPSDFVQEISSSETARNVKSLAISIHLHYPEYVERLEGLLKSQPQDTKFFVTATSREVCELLETWNYTNLEIVLCQNRGRNFGPLMSEFWQTLKGFDYVVHLHSKQSVHSTRKTAQRWADSYWGMLGEDQSVFERTIGIMDRMSDVAIAYPLVTDFVKPYQHNWAGSQEAAKTWFSKKSLPFVEEPLAFPAGGMFIIKPALYGDQLDTWCDYRKFPPESGSLDAEPQHLLERLFGALPSSLGFRHLVYIQQEDRFTLDNTYPRYQRTIYDRRK